MTGRTWRDNGHKALCPLSRIICHVWEQKEDLEDTPRASFDDAADVPLDALGVQQ